MDARQIWEETTKQIKKVYDAREAARISFMLLEDLFDVPREDIMLSLDCELDEKDWKRAVSRLLDSEPIQYITGITYFFGRKLKIGAGALIPRPETEELVDLIIRQNTVSGPKILDIGVGSGCIAISLSLALLAKVYGSDVSPDAIRIARQNADESGANVTLIQNDIMKEPLAIRDLDILVSNPPYIPDQDRNVMHQNVLGYEPALALFVPDDDPLKFYKRIAIEGRTHLKKGGKLYFEIHEHFGAEVKELLKGLGYHEVYVYQDMQGKDRMVSAIN